MDRVPVVTAERLREYIASRQKDGAESATINRELEGLRRAFSLAIASETLATMPMFPRRQCATGLL